MVKIKDVSNTSLCYALYDVDEDMISECIIANCKSSDTSQYLQHSNYTIYDVYTVKNGKPVRVNAFDRCGHRMQYWIGQNNTIIENSSGGCASTVYSVNKLSDNNDCLNKTDEYYTDLDNNEICYFHKDKNKNIEKINENTFINKVKGFKLEKI